MNQLPLFQKTKDDATPRPSDPSYVRKSLGRLLRVARGAQIMPWSESEAASWEKLFPELAASLPAEEAAELVAGFKIELKRLRSTD
jgi:hypothetical protein